MRSIHALSLAGILALSGLVVAQVTTSSGSAKQSSSSSSSQSSSSSSRSGQSSSSQGGTVNLDGRKVFAVLCEPGDNWRADKSFVDQDLQGHVEFLEELKARNILVMAGPFVDNSGGEYVILAKSLKEAQDIVSSDPGARARILNNQIHEWHIAVKSPQALMALMGNPAAEQVRTGR